LINGQLLLIKNERLMLFLNLVDQIGDQPLQLLLRLMNLLLLGLARHITNLLFLLLLQDQLKLILQLLLSIRLNIRLGVTCFISLAAISLLFIVLFLFIILTAILHLISALVAVWILVEVELV